MTRFPKTRSKDEIRERMRLLLQVLPYFYGQSSLALKGGTAINAFLCNLPRLSIDIDMTYVNFSGREQALEGINASLSDIKARIASGMHGTEFTFAGKKGKLLVRRAGVEVQVEVNTVVRGTVFAPWEGPPSDATLEEFSLPADKTRIIDPDEVYAGKLVAMLGRNNPRDLFDVHHLLANEGIGDRMLDAFVVYLASANRPMHELLNPSNSMAVDEIAYSDLLEMMTGKPLSQDELEQAGIRARKIILEKMGAWHRDFLLGMAQGAPDWSLFGNGSLERLPGLQWKLINVRKMDEQKRNDQLEDLRKILET